MHGRPWFATLSGSALRGGGVFAIMLVMRCGPTDFT